jgi:hypothetical protein
MVDGRRLEIKNVSKLNLELNTALVDDQQFAEFAANPQAFAARYNLTIDREISDALKERLTGMKSLVEAQRAVVHPIDRVGTTVWAVAAAVFSLATAKIAVAFVPVDDMKSQLVEIQRIKQLRKL